MSTAENQAPICIKDLIATLSDLLPHVGNIPVRVVSQIIRAPGGMIGVEAGWPTGRLHGLLGTAPYLGLYAEHGRPHLDAKAAYASNPSSLGVGFRQQPATDTSAHDERAADVPWPLSAVISKAQPDLCLLGPFVAFDTARQYADTLRRPGRRVNVRIRKAQIDRIVVHVHYVSIRGTPDDIATIVADATGHAPPPTPNP